MVERKRNKPKKADLEILALNINKLIKKKGFKSTEKFCHESGISKNTVYDILKKMKDVRLSTLRRIADALEVKISKLID